MQDAQAAPADLAVYVGDQIPYTFEDAFAVVAAGGLTVWRWSTRTEPKRRPIAEFPPGMWTGYRHLGGQGDEPAQPKPTPAVSEQPGAVQAQGADSTHPFDREEQLSRPPAGGAANLRPAQVRPALPPADFPVPTHRLPQRSSSGDETGVLPAVPATIDASRSRRRTRRNPVPGSLWMLAFTAVLGVLAAVR